VQKVVDACAAAFPELDKTINRVAAKLARHPIPGAKGRPGVDLQTMISLFESRNTSGKGPNTTGHRPAGHGAQRLGRQPDAGHADAGAFGFAGPVDTRASDLAARFGDTISQSIIRTGSREETIRFVRPEAALTTLPRDPARAGHRPSAAADVAAVFAAVSKEARGIYQSMIGVLDLLLVACQYLTGPVGSRGPTAPEAAGLHGRPKQAAGHPSPQFCAPPF
jgi:hypothetical protein